MKRAISTLVVLGVLAARPALGAEPTPVDNEVGVGLFGGVLVLSTKHELYQLEARWAAAQAVNADFGLRLGWMPWKYLGAEGELAFMPSRAGDTGALMYGVRAHLLAQYPIGRFTPFVLLGGGGLGVNSPMAALGKDLDGAFHWGLGAKISLLDFLDLRLDVRHLVSARHDIPEVSGPVTSHLEAFLGLTYVFGRPVTTDEDEDGITDGKDKCPTLRGIPPDGCPRDTDGDGVYDKDDKCPDLAGLKPEGCPPDTDKDGLYDADDKCPTLVGPAPHGCPDKDKDGIPDRDDQCDDEPGVAPTGCPADQDKDGVVDEKDQCPEVSGVAPHGCPDQDRDGVVDAQDKCPDVAGVPPDGCPPDMDKDGLPDDKDKCMAEPETVNGFQDDDGCPDELPAALKAFTGTIEGINFELGKAVIQKGSFGKLDQAVKVLKEFTEVKLEVSGHTDDTGAREVNVKLSQERAEAVKQYFVGKGVDAARITARGAGPDEPTADNKTPAGRAKNRRIEFKVVK